MDRPEEFDRLAADWIALWESEIAALGQDAELAEAWSTAVALMAAASRAQAAQLAAAAKWRAHEPHPPRPPPPAAAPDAGGGPGHGGDDAAAALRTRLAGLEQRLAALEGKPTRGGPDRGKARKPRVPSAG